MNFLKYILIILTGATGVWACQPKGQAPIPAKVENNPIPLVSSISYGIDPDAEKWYEYNNEGEILRYNSIIDTVSFMYTKDSIVKKYGNSANQWQTSVTYYLNQYGRADSSSIRGENDELISTYRFEYDDMGYLVKTIQDVFTSGNKYKQTMTYKDGNLDEIVTYTFEGKPYARYVYTYYPDKENLLNINLHHILEDFLSKDRLGKGNRNLIRSMVNVSMDGDTLSQLAFSYPNPVKENTLIQVEEDILNENSTERTYHFQK